MNCVDGKRANGHAGQAATDLVHRFGLRLVGVALVSVLAGCQVTDVASDEMESADLAPAPPVRAAQLRWRPQVRRRGVGVAGFRFQRG